MEEHKIDSKTQSPEAEPLTQLLLTMILYQLMLERRISDLEQELSAEKSRIPISLQFYPKPLDGFDPKGYLRSLILHPEEFGRLTSDQQQQLLRVAYTYLALRFHPDAGGRNETMKKINQAYHFLKDPENRQLYLKH